MICSHMDADHRMHIIQPTGVTPANHIDMWSGDHWGQTGWADHAKPRYSIACVVRPKSDTGVDIDDIWRARLRAHIMPAQQQRPTDIGTTPPGRSHASPPVDGGRDLFEVSGPRPVSRVCKTSGMAYLHRVVRQTCSHHLLRMGGSYSSSNTNSIDGCRRSISYAKTNASSNKKACNTGAQTCG